MSSPSFATQNGAKPGEKLGVEPGVVLDELSTITVVELLSSIYQYK